MIALAATSVWLGRNQTLYDFWFYITNFSRYPMEIYRGPSGTPLRWLFTFCMPVLVVVNVPARLLAKPLDEQNWRLAGFRHRGGRRLAGRLALDLPAGHAALPQREQLAFAGPRVNVARWDEVRCACSWREKTRPTGLLARGPLGHIAFVIRTEDRRWGAINIRPGPWPRPAA